MKKTTIRLISALLMLVILLMVAGCDETGKKPSAAGTGSGKINQPVKPKPREEVTVRLYYPDRQGEWLHEVTAKVAKDDKYRASVQKLLDGTKEKGLMNIFPKGTKIKSLQVKNGRATIDFSKEMASNFPGGSVVEEMMYGSVVNTLTAFPEIKSVKIFIDGKDTKILSNMDIVDPFERMPELIKKK